MSRIPTEWFSSGDRGECAAAVAAVACDPFRPLRCVDLEISEPLEDLGGLDPYCAVLAVVRLHGVPLGYVAVPVEGGGCHKRAQANEVTTRLGDAVFRRVLVDAASAGELHHLLREGTVDVAVHPHPSRSWPALTVAVCTRNRPEDASRCLTALGRLNYPSLDCIVVDNAPDDDRTERMVLGLATEVRYVREPRPGLNWARNRALAEARSELIAYVDDDAVVDAGWAHAICAILSDHPGVAAVTGLVAPLELETEAQLLFERRDGFGRGFERRWLHAGRQTPIATHFGNIGALGTGANMAFRVTAVQAVGGFDPALDAGTASEGGGDLDMFFRLLKAGHTVVYEPAALVRHRHREDREGLREQLASWGVGMQAYLARNMRAHRDERRALGALAARLLLVYFPRRFAQAAVGAELPLDLVIAEWGGALRGPFRYPAAVEDARRVAARFGPIEGASVAPSRLATRSSDLRAVRTVSLDVEEPLPSTLPGPDDSVEVAVEVTRGRAHVGTLRIVCGGDPVGRARLADALASQLGPALLERPEHFRSALCAAIGRGRGLPAIPAGL